MTATALQLVRQVMQRDPIGTAGADGVRSTGCAGHHRPPARAHVHDFEAVVRQDHRMVTHYHDRFFWTDAEHGVLRATA